MSKDVIVRGVTYTGIEKLNLPISGGSALFRDTSDGDAVAGEILSGKKAYNANGAVNGNMTNQGAVSGTISDKNTPYSVPAGYHNGSGTVDIAAAQKALLIPGNIRDGVSILGVTGDYTGGGGGPTSSDAILLATAPAGSTVTATKGGVTLLPTMWAQAADNTRETALFVISQTMFDAVNPWTVTATLGTDTASDAVTVNAAKQYDVELAFGFFFIKNGVILSTFTPVIWTGNNQPSITSDYGGLGYTRLYRAGNANYNAAFIAYLSPGETFPVTGYSKLNIDYEIINCFVYYTNDDRPACGLGAGNTTNSNANWYFKQELAETSGPVSRTTVTADISAISGEAFLRLRARSGSNTSVPAEIHFFNIWLSR